MLKGSVITVKSEIPSNQYQKRLKSRTKLGKRVYLSLIVGPDPQYFVEIGASNRRLGSLGSDT